MNKRPIIIAMLLTTIMGFTACGSNAATESNTTTAESGENASAVEYVEKLFDNSYVHTINVEISDEDWDDLTANPLDKTKYTVNITIDGETVSDVSFATKGNTSLSSVTSEGNDRYSFKINFGKYVDDQTYYGLNKLNLQNIYADATYMKDYICYEIFKEVGVDAPLTSYVSLSINGELFGLYLAVEDVSESYLNRTNDGEGVLYKPETESLAGMDDIGNFDMGDMELPEGMEDFNPENMQMPDNMPDGMDFGLDSNGADLKYTDDELSSYTDIFDNAETDASEDDNRRVIASLKGISESSGSELENYLDTDEIIRYFVAHNFVMNYDSYTGTMLHNYYLYENNGILSMLPWDYNLAFGSFMGQGQSEGNTVPELPQGTNSDTSDNEIAENENTTNSKMQETATNIDDKETPTANGENAAGQSFSFEDMNMAIVSNATDIVNYDIDSPLSGATEENRPMWSWIVNNEEYLEKYHDVFDSLIADYFESGEFATEMERVYNMIRPYVEADPSAFYSVDEFDAAYDTLLKFCNLRAESIRKQLSGEEADVDASDIDISAMGSHMNNTMGNIGKAGDGD